MMTLHKIKRQSIIIWTALSLGIEVCTIAAQSQPINDRKIIVHGIPIIEFVNPSAPCGGGFPCWLTRKGAKLINSVTNLADPEIVEAKNYYQQIEAFRDAPTLDAFKRKNGFVSNSGSPLNAGFQAFYFNNGDLQIGREMHCNETGRRVACYVSNYGPQPFPVGTLDNNTTYVNVGQALTELEAVASGGGGAGTPLPFATVAMESPAPAPGPATVTVNEWDGVTNNLNPPKNCLADYAGNRPPSDHDVDTGLDIETGDIIHFSAAGSLWTGYCFIGRNAADGMAWTEDGNDDYPLPTAHEAALIGAIGHEGGPYFEIGKNLDYIHTGRAGRLFLRTNDNNPGNGSGSFSVSIEIFRQSVRFYIYDRTSNLAEAAALDSEGFKSFPQMCMGCHGGSYYRSAPPNGNPKQAHWVDGASFLPFDLASFLYSQKPGLTQNDQEEQFRLLNLLVKDTNPNPNNMQHPIDKLIDIFYNNKVNVPATKFTLPQQQQLPSPGWIGHEALYTGFYAHYCRTCHAASQTQDFTDDFSLFDSSLAFNDICSGTMPHAEVPYQALTGAKLDFVAARDLTALRFPCLRAVLPQPIVRAPAR